MTSKFIASTIGLAFFLSTLLVFAQDHSQRLRLTLEDCIHLAMENHAKLKAKDREIDASLWRLEESNARFWPIMEYQSRMGPVPQDAAHAASSFFSGDITYFQSFKSSLAIPLYTFGQITAAEKLATQGVEGAKVGKEKEESEIRFRVKQLYYGIQLGREIKGLVADAIRKINNKLKEEEEAPKHSPFDIAKLKVFKIDLDKRFSEAQMKETLAKEALRIQLGLEESIDFELARSYLLPTRKELLALENYQEFGKVDRADSSLINIGVEAKRLEGVLERRKLWPLIGLAGFVDMGRTTGVIRNLSTTDDFSNPFNFTRAGVALEIRGKFDFHGSHARINRLESEYFKVQMEGGLAKRGIDLEIEEAYRELLHNKNVLSLADQKLSLSQQMLFLSKSNLELGVGEEEDYTDALQLVLQSRAEYLKALFDYNVAVAKLDWKAGR